MEICQDCDGGLTREAIQKVCKTCGGRNLTPSASDVPSESPVESSTVEPEVDLTESEKKKSTEDEDDEKELEVE